MNGRFSINEELITVPEGNIPSFIKMRSSDKTILPHRLHDLFRGTKACRSLPVLSFFVL